MALQKGFVKRVAFQQNKHMGVSENRGTPKSSILIGFSIINHPFWGTTIFGNSHIYIYILQTPNSKQHVGCKSLNTYLTFAWVAPDMGNSRKLDIGLIGFKASCWEIA